MNHYKVGFYKTARGEELVLEFILRQDKATQTKIGRFIDLLKVYGPDLGMPQARFLGSGLYELRIRGKNEVRIFYISLKQDNLMLLHAFNKRTQKIPEKELRIARSRQQELTAL